MCEPVTLTAIAIGAATGAGASALTGGNVLQGALLGGITGGAGGAAFGAVGTNIFSSVAGQTLTSAAASGFGAAAVGGIAGGLLGGPKAAGAPAARQAQQDFSVKHDKTGSGFVGSTGARRASDALRQSKRRQQARALGQDSQSITVNTGVTNTGLSIV